MTPYCNGISLSSLHIWPPGYPILSVHLISNLLLPNPHMRVIVIFMTSVPLNSNPYFFLCGISLGFHIPQNWIHISPWWIPHQPLPQTLSLPEINHSLLKTSNMVTCTLDNFALGTVCLLKRMLWAGWAHWILVNCLTLFPAMKQCLIYFFNPVPNTVLWTERQ